MEIANPIVINRHDLIDLQVRQSRNKMQSLCCNLLFQVLNYSLQVTHQKVSFTAGGLFVIDEKIIYMVID